MLFKSPCAAGWLLRCNQPYSLFIFKQNQLLAGLITKMAIERWLSKNLPAAILLCILF